jgi:rubredoxin
MDNVMLPSGTTALAEVPTRRSCTRCDGEQHLVGGSGGMGKYRCEVCELVIGFDLDADPAEFLLGRGLPSRYTKDVFGSQLLGSELRLS